jgi:hypothetical protein
MLTIHCHFCGGFIANPAGVVYREANASSPAVPHSALCACEHAVVYGTAPGGGLRGVHYIRSASRN